MVLSKTLPLIVIVTIALLKGLNKASPTLATNEIMKINLIGKTITSTPLSTIELHARGVFFGIIYKESLTFKNDSTVILSQKVIT